MAIGAAGSDRREVRGERRCAAGDPGHDGHNGHRNPSFRGRRGLPGPAEGECARDRAERDRGGDQRPVEAHHASSVAGVVSIVPMSSGPGVGQDTLSRTS